MRGCVADGISLTLGRRMSREMLPIKGGESPELCQLLCDMCVLARWRACPCPCARPVAGFVRASAVSWIASCGVHIRL